MRATEGIRRAGEKLREGLAAEGDNEEPAPGVVDVVDGGVRVGFASETGDKAGVSDVGIVPAV